ncbi:hypothetical protein M514_10180 [Trichuris suis]|uniref:HTH CENPB-type domain-containing protein n=1 Tax=Trichuris suis TaxID=68888 RepID=A0A085N3L0_9BILA|nr:hypothetical protein M514_10180 [Trichuris suis]
MSELPDSKSTGSGRKRKALTVGENLEILKRYKRNETTRDIVKATGIKESTLRTIRSNAEKIKQTCVSGTSSSIAMSIRTRPKILEKMEKLLSIWIETQTTKRIGTTLFTIRQKAVTIYEDLKKQSTNPAEIPPFTASSGWFCRFKNRYNFHNVRLCAEAGSADVDPAQTFPIEVQNVVKEKGYCLDQIFNFDETNLYLKRMPKRSYISREHRHATGICAAKDRVTVMLGANASGDLKLKPLVIHRHANLRALRGIVKSSLGVYYRYSKRGWMTAQVCLDIFSNAYANDIKKYLNEKNLAFKVLVITDSASSHPPMIAGLDPNVHFVFLPARTTSLLQPLDQGVIGAFKAYYLRRTFKMLIDATDGENCETVMEFWKNYNLRMAIDNIVEAWNDVSKQCLHRVWRKLIPDLICDFKDFEPSAQVCEITESCVQLANRLGFEEVEYQDIEDILNCQPDELTTEELQELSVAGEAERREEDDENQEAPPPPPRQMTTAELSNTLETIEQRL